jgi:ATP-binding cassette subfamily B (MDR/TAP) protein 1
MSVVVASMTITVVAPYVVSFQRAGTAAAQLFTIIDRTSGTNPFEETKMDSPKQNDVSELKLNDVTFNYPSRPGLKVLDRFSLRIPSRKVTALVVSVAAPDVGFYDI